MGRKKTSKSAKLVSLAIAPFLVSNVFAQNGYIKVYNLVESAGVSCNYVRFLESMNDDLYVKNPPVSSEIFYSDTNEVMHSFAGVDNSKDKLFRLVGSFNGVIPDGAKNYIKIQQIRPFSPDLLITCRVSDRGGVRVYDVKKLLAQSSNSTARIDLPPITNSIDGARYFTNDWFFAFPRASITNFSLDNSINARLGVKLKPGTVAWPLMTTNVNGFFNATQYTNQARYLEITTNNFGGNEGLSWTNLPLYTNDLGFFGIAVGSYDSSASNILAGSEAQFGLVPRTAETNLEAVITKISEKADNSNGKFRVLKSWNK